MLVLNSLIATITAHELRAIAIDNVLTQKLSSLYNSFLLYTIKEMHAKYFLRGNCSWYLLFYLSLSFLLFSIIIFAEHFPVNARFVA